MGGGGGLAAACSFLSFPSLPSLRSEGKGNKKNKEEEEVMGLFEVGFVVKNLKMKAKRGQRNEVFVLENTSY